jgi:hypothetical protein
MRRLLLLVAVIACGAGVVSAQNGSISISSDIGATDCGFVDAGGLVQVFVWHVNTPGATASEWMLDVTPAVWTHLGDTADFDLVVGTSVTGASVSYEVCLQGTFKLMTVNFFGSNTAPCTQIGIVAAPGKSGVRAVDCAEHAVYVPGGVGIANPDASCPCPG